MRESCFIYKMEVLTKLGSRFFRITYIDRNKSVGFFDNDIDLLSILVAIIIQSGLNTAGKEAFCKLRYSLVVKQLFRIRSYCIGILYPEQKSCETCVIKIKLWSFNKTRKLAVGIRIQHKSDTEIL